MSVLGATHSGVAGQLVANGGVTVDKLSQDSQCCSPKLGSFILNISAFSTETPILSSRELSSEKKISFSKSRHFPFANTATMQVPLLRLQCGVNSYEWGKKGNDSAAARFAAATPSDDLSIQADKPYAEVSPLKELCISRSCVVSILMDMF